MRAARLVLIKRLFHSVNARHCVFEGQPLMACDAVYRLA